MSRGDSNEQLCPPLKLQHLASIVLEALIRKNSDIIKDPSCSECSALSTNQLPKAHALRNYVSKIPSPIVSDILHRILNYRGEPSDPRKASPMDIFILIHSSLQKFVYPKLPDHAKRYPIPNTQKSILESIHRCKFLEVLDLSGMDDHATPLDYNDFQNSSDCKEHYLYVLEDSIYHLEHLVILNIGNFITNSICKAISETCSNLRELRFCGPCKVSDLGLRYIAGTNLTIGSRRRRIGHLSDEELPYVTTKPISGCFKLRILSLMDVEKISLHTISLLLIHLPELLVLEHNHLLEAIWLMNKTGMSDSKITFKLLSYEGRGPAQCNPEYFAAFTKLCPNIESLRLCMTFSDTFISLFWFRRLRQLSIFRVSSVDNLDTTLTLIGHNLRKLELRNCTDFQSGAALHIRKNCPQLQSLILEIDNTDADSHGLEGVLHVPIEANNVITLQNHVQDLHSRLDRLQVTMLSVMNNYGPLNQLEELYLKNLSMGSLLIILPFAPNLRTCTLKYSTRNGEMAPNLSDSLFFKIFEKNRFEKMETLSIWCKTLGVRTARWFTENCSNLKTLKNLSFWDIDLDEQVQLWKEGRQRKPIPVEIDF
ncbi:unnamed protein product [Lepeophtheirus salmonis]|uniref:(salmon louse) hypothetical protein n=2 Tax=Lepeophtheirus salmonis TaxID=72036 RepID=A0A7R8H715_LEPSM|nr:unnamed protein product [Lepeophtheirus salmonis]CAF2899607.1 unnamed protein product [Lepeophtheirus salmonis]